jgi:hypothetical protein
MQTLIGEAPEMTARDTWPKPDKRLVNDDRPPAPVLDDDALPAGWQKWISNTAAACACPREYVTAGLTLAVMSDAAWLRRPQADGQGRSRGDWEVNPRILEAKQ